MSSIVTMSFSLTLPLIFVLSVTSLFHYVESRPLARLATASGPAFTYIGCFGDSSTRVMTPISTASDWSMTVEKCASLASQSNFVYFALQFHYSCFGSNSPTYDTLGPATCNLACSGNIQQTCGGAYANSVYAITTATVVPTTPPPTRSPYKYVGCFGDANARVMTQIATQEDWGMTIENCASLASQLNYAYFALQFHYQCWGSNSTSYNTLGPATCDLYCTGNAQQTCGGAYANSVYAFAA